MAAREPWVGLLRGINVGGRRSLPMATLRGAVASLGYADIRSHIQSGNVVFTGAIADRARASAALTDAIEAASGVRSVVVLRSGAELAALVGANPFANGEHHEDSFHLACCDAPPPAAHLDRCPPAAYAPSDYRVVGADIYLYLPEGMGRSRLAAELLGRRIEVTPTVRNWRTVCTLVEMARG